MHQDTHDSRFTKSQLLKYLTSHQALDNLLYLSLPVTATDKIFLAPQSTFQLHSPSSSAYSRHASAIISPNNHSNLFLKKIPLLTMSTPTKNPTLSPSANSSQSSKASLNNEAAATKTQTPEINTAATTPTQDNNSQSPTVATKSLKRKATDGFEAAELQRRLEATRAGTIIPNDGNIEIIYAPAYESNEQPRPAKRPCVAAALGQNAPEQNGAHMVYDAAQIAVLKALKKTIDDRLTSANLMEHAEREISKLKRKYDVCATSTSHSLVVQQHSRLTSRNRSLQLSTPLADHQTKSPERYVVIYFLHCKQ